MTVPTHAPGSGETPTRRERPRRDPKSAKPANTNQEARRVSALETTSAPANARKMRFRDPEAQAQQRTVRRHQKLIAASTPPAADRQHAIEPAATHLIAATHNRTAPALRSLPRRPSSTRQTQLPRSRGRVVASLLPPRRPSRLSGSVTTDPDFSSRCSDNRSGSQRLGAPAATTQASGQARATVLYRSKHRSRAPRG